MVPNTGQCRQMGCLGSCPGDEAERDGYGPVEEETAYALSQYRGTMWVVCSYTSLRFHLRLVYLPLVFSVSVMHRG